MGVNLSGADLSRCNFESADIASANFTGAKLCNAKVMHAKVENAIFDKVDMDCIQGLETMKFESPLSGKYSQYSHTTMFKLRLVLELEGN